MAIHKSAEDYLERILMLTQNGNKVRSIDIAQSFNYSRASISRAINNLKASEYIVIDSNGYIELTKKGKNVASEMYKRHHILTDLFVSLGVPLEIAKEDACKIEHDLSDITFKALENYFKNNQK